MNYRLYNILLAIKIYLSENLSDSSICLFVINNHEEAVTELKWRCSAFVTTLVKITRDFKSGHIYRDPIKNIIHILVWMTFSVSNCRYKDADSDSKGRNQHTTRQERGCPIAVRLYDCVYKMNYF